MAWRLRSGDIAGFKILFSLGILYGLISVLVYSIIHMKFITPLPMDAPPDRFSEARAIEHVRVLSEDIGGRQEGRQGLRLAAQYIKTQLEMMKERAQPGIRIEIEETIVNGSFNMFFLRHSISLAYRNHTNIIMRKVTRPETGPCRMGTSSPHEPEVAPITHYNHHINHMGRIGDLNPKPIHLARHFDLMGSHYARDFNYKRFH
ncbi:hypothetical protein FXO38_29981 [Capsicum annuum]|nr:hypothetical protein FXO38_29981 [Capsicum annuum]